MSGATPASPQARIAWIDAARGIGIVLVVIGHVMRSLVAQGVAPDDRAHQLVDGVIYDFHMPLFFLLSGLFARQVAAGKRMAFLRGRGQAIVYPYVLWSLVQGVMAIAASAHTSHPVTWRMLAEIPWEPIAQFWFLYVLFLCQLLLLLPGRFAILAFLPVGMGLSLAFGPAEMPLRLCYDLPFFAAGYYLTAPRATRWLESRARTILIAVVAWLLFALLFRLCEAYADVGASARAFGWAKGLSGAVGALAIARLIAPYAKFLLELGRASMPIYLLHVIFAAAFRTVLLRLWPHGGELGYAALLTLVGIIGPYVVFRAAERLGWDALLGFSTRPRGAARLAPELALGAGIRG
jgi:fucose 4-O-acetylase-like acetyltransferase